MKQIKDAYSYLLDKVIIHRDIKLDNILIKSKDSLEVKLTDFGCSKITPVGITYCGTPKYMSYEVMEENRNYNYKADLWAIGLCFWELIFGYGQFPFNTKSIDTMKAEMKKFSGDNLRFPTKPKLPEFFYSFFKSILSLMPETRMEAQAFVQHQIFSYNPDTASDL